MIMTATQRAAYNSRLSELEDDVLKLYGDGSIEASDEGRP